MVVLMGGEATLGGTVAAEWLALGVCVGCVWGGEGPAPTTLVGAAEWLRPRRCTEPRGALRTHQLYYQWQKGR